ncbi:MAG: AIPR family protein, partial [Candidatus Omnitrophota bacterium]
MSDLKKIKWVSCYKSRKDLHSFKENSLLFFALDLRFGIDDFVELASNSLTDGGDDKKTDLIYIDSENGYVVIAQAYISKKWDKKEAPASKASDLNTAASWILNSPLDRLPQRIFTHAEEVRRCIKENIIKSIYFWYAHNLPESKNVDKELKNVEETAKTLVAKNFPDARNVEICATEVGVETLEKWYKTSQMPILVSDTFNIPISGGYKMKAADWESYITAIPASWLYDKFKKYKGDIFSANIRGYLGSRKRDENINNGIKKTGCDDPEHFWVFNNGITALVNEFKENKNKGKLEIVIRGISIVNGAQTTGALGSLEKSPAKNAYVPIRFVVCPKLETIQNIVKYNNSQNKITAPDFRSSDSIQAYLSVQFSELYNITYLSRRGGCEDIIRRISNSISAIAAGQALAATHGFPEIAYNQKTYIWENDGLYSRFFNEKTTAQHILFVYSLLKAIEYKKLQLVRKSKAGKLTKIEENQLGFLRLRGAIILFCAAISQCLDIFIGSSIPNMFALKFKAKKISLGKAIKIWAPIIDIGISFSDKLKDGLSDGLKNKDKIESA